MTPDELAPLLTEYAAFKRRWDHLTQKHARTGEEMNELGSALPRAREDIAKRATALLEETGPVTDWFRAALRGDLDEVAMHFAMDALTYCNGFPRALLVDFVFAAIRHGFGDYLTSASMCHGRAPVYDAMTLAAEAGILGYRDRRFLTYYVRGPRDRDEDPATVSAAYRRLQDVTFDAPDAPPGAQRARPDEECE
jgi:hypothetical protein